jgi:hypothetical protein
MGTDPFYSRWAMGYFPWGCGWDGSTSWTYPCELMGDDGKPLPPDVWEAMREGVDDWYYLLTLGNLIAKNPAAPVAVEARKWLDTLRGRMDLRSERKNPFANGEEMDKARATAAGFIEQLTAK